MDADRDCVDTAPDIHFFFSFFQKRLFALIRVRGGPVATFPFPSQPFGSGRVEGNFRSIN